MVPARLFSFSVQVIQLRSCLYVFFFGSLWQFGIWGEKFIFQWRILTFFSENYQVFCLIYIKLDGWYHFDRWIIPDVWHNVNHNRFLIFLFCYIKKIEEGGLKKNIFWSSCLEIYWKYSLLLQMPRSGPWPGKDLLWVRFHFK